MGPPDQSAPPRSTNTTLSSAAPSEPLVNAPAPAPVRNQPQSNAPPPGVAYRQSDSRPTGPQLSANASAPSAIDKRVTFAQQAASAPSRVLPPVAEADYDPPEDESFGLNSEDDDFFASIDLGEDLGGPINFDEGAGGVQSANDEGPSVLGGYRAPKPQASAAQVGQPGRPAYGQLADAPDTGSRTPFAQQSHSSSGHGRPSSQAGGFHFPSNVNAKPGPAIGMKRPADAMRDSARRPAQGMGLSHVAGNPGRREPLGVLDLSDGGDLKRARR